MSHLTKEIPHKEDRNNGQWRTSLNVLSDHGTQVVQQWGRHWGEGLHCNLTWKLTLLPSVQWLSQKSIQLVTELPQECKFFI